MTCAPKPQMIPPPDVRASTSALDDRRKSACGEDVGQQSSQPAQPVATPVGAREILGFRLALTGGQRVGADLRQVELVVGKGHGAIINGYGLRLSYGLRVGYEL